MAVKVALVGATGNLGPAILKELLSAGFEVTVLSRKGSTSTDSLPQHANQEIVKVDYEDFSELTSALNGVEVVITTLAITAQSAQNKLIDASIAAGVGRFIPSEFGSDMDNPLNKELPPFEGKVASREYLEKAATEHSNFTYTYIYNNVFFDWGLQVGFLMDLKQHKATLYDGGDVAFSATTLPTVAKAVVGVINDRQATKNRAVRIHDAAPTLNKIIAFAKKVDGQEWTTEVKDTKEEAKKAWDELAKSEPDMIKATMGFLHRASLSREHNPDFTDKLDNELLGLPVWGDAEIEALIRSLLSAGN